MTHPMPVAAGTRRGDDGHYIAAQVGDVELTIHEAATVPGSVNVEADADLTGATGLLVHVNEQLVFDSRRAGGDLTGVHALTGQDRAEAIALCLADAVREAVMAAFGRLGPAAFVEDYLDAAGLRLDAIHTAADSAQDPQ